MTTFTFNYRDVLEKTIRNFFSKRAQAKAKNVRITKKLIPGEAIVWTCNGESVRVTDYLKLEVESEFAETFKQAIYSTKENA
jgi:hypothetical protein